MNEKLLLLAMKTGCKYILQYADYDSNQWTAPVLLTEDRIKKMVDDFSVKEIHIIITP